MRPQSNPQDQACIYPLDPYDQWRSFRDELASIAACIGRDYLEDPLVDVTYWQERAARLIPFCDQLHKMIQAEGRRARARLAERGELAD